MSTSLSRMHLGLTALSALVVTQLPMWAGCSDAVTDGDTALQIDGALVEDNTVVRAISVNSGLALDVVGISTQDGAEVQQWDYWKALNQRWRLHHVGGDDYELRSVNSDKCLDVAGAVKDQPAPIIQWSCHGGENQRWKLRRGGDGSYEVVSALSGYCLDVIGVSKTPGERLHQWPCVGGENQKWRLDRLDGDGNPIGDLESGGSGPVDPKPPTGNFGNGDIHADRLGIYAIPDINGRWREGGGGGACAWPGTQATLNKFHEILPNAWIRWDNETGHGPDTPENVEMFVSCAQQAGIPMIISADAVDGYDNWWALGGRQPPWSIVDIANGPYLRHAYEVAKRHANVQLVETLNEPDGEWFVSDPDNADHFRYYMSKLYEATNNDFNKIVGPAAAFRNNIFNDYLSRGELRNVSYHTYDGASGLVEHGGKDIFVTEYGGFDMNPRALLDDLWHAERAGKLAGGIKKVFYVDLQSGFSEDTMEGDHFALRGWVRALGAFQALASVSSRAYFDDGAQDFLATDDGRGQFAALLWSNGGRGVPNVSIEGATQLNVLRVIDAKSGAAQCARASSNPWVSVRVEGNTARIDVNNLEPNAAVLVTTKSCDALAN